MDRKEFTELLSEICDYAVDLYSQRWSRAPSFSLKIVNQDLIKQSTAWPDTSYLKDGYGGWDWQKIWRPKRYDSNHFFIALCEGKALVLFSVEEFVSQIQKSHWSTCKGMQMQ